MAKFVSGSVLEGNDSGKAWFEDGNRLFLVPISTTERPKLTRKESERRRKRRKAAKASKQRNRR